MLKNFNNLISTAAAENSGITKSSNINTVTGTGSVTQTPGTVTSTVVNKPVTQPPVASKPVTSTVINKPVTQPSGTPGTTPGTSGTTPGTSGTTPGTAPVINKPVTDTQNYKAFTSGPYVRDIKIDTQLYNSEVTKQRTQILTMGENTNAYLIPRTHVTPLVFDNLPMNKNHLFVIELNHMAGSQVTDNGIVIQTARNVTDIPENIKKYSRSLSNIHGLIKNIPPHGALYSSHHYKKGGVIQTHNNYKTMSLNSKDRTLVAIKVTDSYYYEPVSFKLMGSRYPKYIIIGIKVSDLPVTIDINGHELQRINNHLKGALNTNVCESDCTGWQISTGIFAFLLVVLLVGVVIWYLYQSNNKKD